jgi:hypothetical protein
MLANKSTSDSLLRLIGLILLATLLAGCGSTLQTITRVLQNPDATMAGNADQTVPPEGTREAAFHQALETAGFDVKRGSTVVVYPIDLVDQKMIDSAAGNNAGQPYKRLQIPLIGKEIGDKEAHNVGIFKLQPQEAIVYVGPTPPLADYFSYALFLWVRHADSVIPKGDWSFPTVGDPLNNALIKTEDGDDPFGAQTMVIFTPDQGTYEQIASAAETAGFPSSMINLIVVPSSLLRLGLMPDSDSLMILVRTGNLPKGDVGDQYLANDYYGSVYRVAPKVKAEPQPYAAVPPRDRSWKPEAELVPDLEGGLARLEAAILAQDPHAEPYISVRWFYDSWDVLQDDPALPAYRKFVAAESSDTTYFRTATTDGAPANFKLGPNDTAIVYGVNHEATGLATYSSFAAYGDWPVSSCDTPEAQIEYIFGCGDPVWNGIAGMTSNEFEGSAEAYLPGDPVAPYLYAVKVVRGACPEGDAYCLVVPEPSTPGSVDGIPLDKPLLFGYRAYLNSVTHGGPSYDDIIPDRVIRFPAE